MSEPRNVTLELLRHGPPHNQLLSPLTQYLALCGNHPGETINVPYEHNHFIARHRSLMYEREFTGDAASRRLARENRELQLQITSQEMSAILSRIPGLISELKEVGREDDFTHFELVLSAQELAMLPFELATAPNGFPGAGQALTLQSQSPLCMTRRVRRVDNDRIRWPDRPRILFVESLPDNDAAVLVRPHLVALCRAIEPWMQSDESLPDVDDDNRDTVVRGLGEHITVLRQASVDDLISELRSGEYTHVHILAHGMEYTEGVDGRFGLQFRDRHSQSGGDIVGGTRFASMVRSCMDGRRLTTPAVITIASCNGANGGSVIGAGSSVAHAIHEAGVPLVISSQFPLSFPGSILLTEYLYEGLLWGADPRELLNCVRRQLKARLPETHDWASLVAYAALPAGINFQLRRIRISQAVRSIWAAFSYSDRYARDWHDWWDTYEELPSDDPDEEELERVRASLEKLTNPARHREMFEKLKPGKKRLISILADTSARKDERAKAAGLLASTEKRQAEVEWMELMRRKWRIRTPIDSGNDAEETGATENEWADSLGDSIVHYRMAFDMNRENSWALVQWLCLSIVRAVPPTVNQKDGDDHTDWIDNLNVLESDCHTAWSLLSVECHDESRQVCRTAASNLMDMELLSLFFWDASPDREQVEEKFNGIRTRLTERADFLIRTTDFADWEIRSRIRQLRRYINWFFHRHYEFTHFDRYERFPNDLPGLVKLLAREVLNQILKLAPGMDQP